MKHFQCVLSNVSGFIYFTIIKTANSFVNNYYFMKGKGNIKGGAFLSPYKI